MIKDSEFVVLNTIYLKKLGTSQAIAAISGLTLAEVGAVAQAFVSDGKLIEVPGGLMLMPPGTQAVLDYYRDNYQPLRESPTTARWYERFEPINSRFIALVSEWQASADERTAERMFQQVGRLIKLITELIEAVPRYAAYVRRFEYGMSAVDRGEQQYVCSPMVDSVHNVWFEFHEDILAVLGRPRDTT
jgi:hypothetical protein